MECKRLKKGLNTKSIGPADIVQLLLSEENLDESCLSFRAALLGYVAEKDDNDHAQDFILNSPNSTDVLPAIDRTDVVEKLPIPADQETTDLSKNKVSAYPEPLFYRFAQLTKHKNKRSDEPDELPPLDSNAQDVFDQWAAPTFRPLVPWSQVWPTLMSTVGYYQRGHKPCIKQIVQRLSKGLVIRKIPYQQRLLWPQTCDVLLDYNERLHPLYIEFNHLAKLVSTWQTNETRIICIQHDNWQDAFLWGKRKKKPTPNEKTRGFNRRYQLHDGYVPQADKAVFLMTDLGCYDLTQQACEAWIERGKAWQRLGIRPVVLMPCPAVLWHEPLQAYYEMIEWGDALKTGLVAKQNLSDEMKKFLTDLDTFYDSKLFHQLLVMMSPLLGVESHLLRYLRLLLTRCNNNRLQPYYQQLGVAIEVFLWQHSDIAAANNEVSLRKAVQKRLRLEVPEVLSHFSKQDQCEIRKFLLSAHKPLNFLVWFEEVINLLNTIEDKINEGGGSTSNLLPLTLDEKTLRETIDQQFQEILDGISDGKDENYLDLTSHVKQQLKHVNIEELKKYVTRLEDRHSSPHWKMSPAQKKLIQITNSAQIEKGEVDLTRLGGLRHFKDFLPKAQWPQPGVVCIQHRLNELRVYQHSEKKSVMGVSPIVSLPVDYCHVVIEEKITDDDGIEKNKEKYIRLDQGEDHLIDILEKKTIDVELDNYDLTIEGIVKPVWAKGIKMTANGLQVSLPERDLIWVNPQKVMVKTENDPVEYLIEKGAFWDKESMGEFFDLDENLNVLGISKPSWASEIGVDDYGIYVNVMISAVTQTFRFIPPGEFLMGSPREEEGHNSYKENKDKWADEYKIYLEKHFSQIDYDVERQFQAVITKGYWLADTTCTQALWQKVMGDNPSHNKSDDLPVEQISWDDIQNFLQKVNQQYPELNLTLPSEMQWEYACRAGTQTTYYFGDAFEKAQINLDSKSTINVKDDQKVNDWGLYQMHGNVWEWCQDAFLPYPESFGIDSNPSGPSDPSFHRVLRGGCWISDAISARSACRRYLTPDRRSDYFGFRLARG